MGKIYVNQTALTIRARTRVDITGAIALKIKYRKPNGTTEGELIAVASAGSTNMIEFVVVHPSFLDVDGQWTFWSDVEFETNKWAPGEPFTKTVFNPGY